MRVRILQAFPTVNMSVPTMVRCIWQVMQRTVIDLFTVDCLVTRRTVIDLLTTTIGQMFGKHSRDVVDRYWSTDCHHKSKALEDPEYSNDP